MPYKDPQKKRNQQRFGRRQKCLVRKAIEITKKCEDTDVYMVIRQGHQHYTFNSKTGALEQAKRAHSWPPSDEELVSTSASKVHSRDLLINSQEHQWPETRRYSPASFQTHTNASVGPSSPERDMQGLQTSQHA